MTDAGPTTENRTLPRRLPNAAYRQREYLTESEVDRLLDAARKRGRNAARDVAAILLRIGMGCERKSFASCVGLRSICVMAGCM